MAEERYTGETRIWFGQYKGKHLMNIPASYYVFLWGQDGSGISDSRLKEWIAPRIDRFREDMKKEKIKRY
jgi:hypothetical protein